MAGEDDLHHAERPAGFDGARKEFDDLLGRRAGGDVEILGRAAEQPVADAAAGEQRGMAGGAQRPRDGAGVRFFFGDGKIRHGGSKPDFGRAVKR